MMNCLFLSPTAPDKQEILRYARAKSNAETDALLDECLAISEGVLNFNVGFCELKFTINGDICDFGDFSASSVSLAKNLSDAKRVFLFFA